MVTIAGFRRQLEPEAQTARLFLSVFVRLCKASSAVQSGLLRRTFLAALSFRSDLLTNFLAGNSLLAFAFSSALSISFLA